MSITSPRAVGVTSPRTLSSARRNDSESAADVGSLAKELRLLKHHLQQEEAQHRQTRQQVQQLQEKCAQLEQHSRSLESAAKQSARSKPEAKPRMWPNLRRATNTQTTTTTTTTTTTNAMGSNTPRSPSPTPSIESQTSASGSTLGIDHTRLHETEFAHLRERLLHCEREADKARDESRALRDELRKTLKSHEAERTEMQRLHEAEVTRLIEAERRQKAQDVGKAEAAEKEARRREKELDREIERLKAENGRALAERSRRIEQDQDEIRALAEQLRVAQAKIRALEAEFAELARAKPKQS